MIIESDQWSGIELRHFAALDAIAVEGSFRGAAVRLGYTQSAVSQQIAVLERIVGEQLIDRPGGPRPVVLTEAGELLRRHAAAIVARLQAAQADLQALSAGMAGSLRVGAYQSVGSTILPAVMREFAAAWPRVEVALTEAHDELLDGLERGELDLAFTVLPLPPGPFESVELLSDPYILVMAASSPLREKRGRVLLGELDGEPMIAFRQCRSCESLETYMTSRGVPPKVVFRSDDNGTVLGMVAAGMGIALMPRLTVGQRHPGIVTLDVDEDIPPRRIGLTWHCDRNPSPAARAFTQAARRVSLGIAGPNAEVSEVAR